MAFEQGFENRVKPAEPLAPHTWFHLGGPAQFFAEPESVEELQALVRRAREEGLAIRLLGGGSNILVRDEGVSGLVVRLSAPAFDLVENFEKVFPALAKVLVACALYLVFELLPARLKVLQCIVGRMGAGVGH